MRKLSVFLFAIAFIALSACSTPETRSKERATAFEKMSAEDQRMVLKGKIREGLDEDAVYVALGHPNRTTRGQKEGKREYSWIYARSETRVVDAYRPRLIRLHDGTAIIREEYSPIYDSYLVDSFEVMFREGKVVGWREL
jgi:hypothetical protein